MLPLNVALYEFPVPIEEPPDGTSYQYKLLPVAVNVAVFEQVETGEVTDGVDTFEVVKEKTVVQLVFVPTDELGCTFQ